MDTGRTGLAIGVVCAFAVVGIVVVSFLVVESVNEKPREGLLYVAVDELNVKNRTGSLIVGVEAEHYYQGYEAWINRTEYVRIIFHNVNYTGPVRVSVADLVAKTTVCEMEFTPQELSVLGYLSVLRGYQFNTICTVTMFVDWVDKSQL